MGKKRDLKGEQKYSFNCWELNKERNVRLLDDRKGDDSSQKLDVKPELEHEQ